LKEIVIDENKLNYMERRNKIVDAGGKEKYEA
jgi:hypothetical protein